MGMEVVCSEELFTYGWSRDCAHSDIWPWYYICLLLGRCMCFHHMGAVSVVLPMCHMGWCGVPSRAVSFLHALGILRFLSWCSISDMVQVPEAWLCWVVFPFSVVIQMFVPTSEVAQGSVNGSCCMLMLNMAADCFSDTVFLSEVWYGAGWFCFLECLCLVHCQVCHLIC